MKLFQLRFQVIQLYLFLCQCLIFRIRICLGSGHRLTELCFLITQLTDLTLHILDAVPHLIQVILQSIDTLLCLIILKMSGTTCRHVDTRLCLAVGRLGIVHLELCRLVVDLEQHVAFLYRITHGIIHLGDGSGYQRHHIDLLLRGDASYVISIQSNFSALGRLYFHIYLFCFGLLAAAAAYHRYTHSQHKTQRQYALIFHGFPPLNRISDRPVGRNLDSLYVRPGCHVKKNEGPIFLKICKVNSREIESCYAGFSAYGGSPKRHTTSPPQCDNVFYVIGDSIGISYYIRKDTVTSATVSHISYISADPYA